MAARIVSPFSRSNPFGVYTNLEKRRLPSTMSSCERGSTKCGSLLCEGTMHDRTWLLLLLCTVARFGYLLRSSNDPGFFSPARPRRGYVVSTRALNADSGCVIGLGKRASEFRRLGVEELQSEAEWRAAWCRCADASAVIQRRHSAVATPLIGQASIQDSTCLGAIQSRHRLGDGFNGSEWSEFVLGEHL